MTTCFIGSFVLAGITLTLPGINTSPFRNSLIIIQYIL
nr:MAG TPA: hypothetical protein [Caudoviricetes sp.]